MRRQELADRLYGLLLLAFPKAMRREMGDEMRQLFRDHLSAASGPREQLAIWLLALGDALLHGFGERAAVAHRRMHASCRSLRQWRWWMFAFRQDVKYAARMLWRQPGMTIVAVLTLAVGIGANTAVFSAVNAVLLRPLPYKDPDRLVMVWEKRAREGVLDNVVSPADFVDWTAMQASFDAMAAMTTTTADLTGSGEPRRLAAAAVSPPFFGVLGVTPALGRDFRPEEDVIGKHRVVILSHAFWQQQLGGNRGILGQTIALNGNPWEVVGVLPATFEFPGDHSDVWTPLALRGDTQPLPRASHQLFVYARLRPGATIESARADMDRVGAQLERQHEDTNRGHGAHVTWLRDEVTEPVKSGLLMLLGAVAFVLLIACVNIANLLLARAASRRKEMAIRAAMGAGRPRLIGQALTESVLLAIIGGVAGLVAGRWAVAKMRWLTPDNLPVLGLNHLTLDARVLAFTAAISILTGTLFGLLPAWQAARQDPNETLKEGGRSASGVRRRLRVALVVSEIALASLLLVGAGLTLRSFRALLTSQPGFKSEGVVAAFVSLPRARYPEASKMAATLDDIERRLAALPGVRAAGATTMLPLSGMDTRRGVGIEGRESTPDAPTRAHQRNVSPGYFNAMGIEILQGRGFTNADDERAPLVLIVNETMAKRYWPGTSPIGKRVRFGGEDIWREVVGVSRDVRHWGLDQAVNPEMYLPMHQGTTSAMTIVMATSAGTAPLAAAVRGQIKAVDPDLPSRIVTMDDLATNSIASRRAAMILLAAFGAIALLLAAAGLYGVMAHLVALRTAEIGIRMTLGAAPRDVMRLVVREGLLQTVCGLALGLTGAAMMMRGFTSMLYGISPADPLTLGAVAIALMTTAVAACLVPARRAMRVDPVVALRTE
jgi:putative ABC transport system permease protein